ncbi:hypothetical protein ParKJ_42170 [Paraburkholderia fungorum]|uniref:Uncharacterized protein n=1 Tax=Paraburkholderia fungorum TaxID=134537 RepID=A0AAP5QKJ6_9BURK|nr:hypothetical protein [Paraburkholderia fungorum]MDT8843994.1 hypothetical protein [Paraburkholderia fungorum]
MSQALIPKLLPVPLVVTEIGDATPTMTKNLVFERGLSIGGENVVLSLFKTTHGFSLQRRLVERDQSVSVQVLPITTLDDLRRFAMADPYSAELAPLYHEVRRQLLADGTIE